MNALKKIGLPPCEEAIDVSRDTLPMAGSRNVIDWRQGLPYRKSAIHFGCGCRVGGEQRSDPPRPDKKIPAIPQIGFVNGLAVYGPNMGTLLEIEVSAIPARTG